MPFKKSDLYGSLGASCDELRRGMDASRDIIAVAEETGAVIFSGSFLRRRDH
jgi:hypothetical protein